jgi:hypothetical protein
VRNKYGARRVELDGLWFDSQREAARYAELKLLVIAGFITDLEVHPTFALMVPILGPADGPITLCTIGKYHADFRYLHLRTGEVVIEDVKSPPTRTALYRLKKKHIEAQYQITIVEVP